MVARTAVRMAERMVVPSVARTADWMDLMMAGTKADVMAAEMAAL